jgi:hypothetical protein
MSDKIEWEVVDAPMPEGPSPQAQARPALKQLLQALLGRWWRWKLFGIAVAASLLLAVLVSLAGIALLVVSVVALLSFAIGKFRQSLRAASSGHGGKLTRFDDRWR